MRRVINVTLGVDVVEGLKKLSEERGVSLISIVRSAIVDSMTKDIEWEVYDYKKDKKSYTLRLGVDIIKWLNETAKKIDVSRSVLVENILLSFLNKQNERQKKEVVNA